MAKWIKVNNGDEFVRESDIMQVRVAENGVVEVTTSDGQTFIAHSQDETTQDFIELFRGLDIGDQA